MPLNRIYQGRVKSLTVLTTRKSFTGESESADAMAEILSGHHQLFQDAVNYHLFQLLRLSTDETSATGKIRQRLLAADATSDSEHEVWARVTRNGSTRPGMRDSLCRSLAFARNISLADAFAEADRRFNQGAVSRQNYELAVAEILADLGGDGAIQQGGREYLPRICDPKFSGGFVRDCGTLAKKASQKDLPARLHDPKTAGALPALRDSLEFEHFANPNQDGSRLGHARCVNLFSEAIGFFEKRGQLSEKHARRLKSLAEALPKDFSLPSYKGGSVNKEALQARFYAFLIFKYLETSELTFSLLRDVHPAPKLPRAGAKPKKRELAVKSDPLLQLGDDPVKLARGTRGSVYPGFTALAVWEPVESQEMAWKEFDIAAFKEALKTLNQIKGRADERAAKLASVEEKLAYIEKGGKKPSPDDEEHDEDGGIVTFAGDLRLAQFKSLLETLKKQDADDAEEYLAEDPHSLRPRAIRSREDLFKEWEKEVGAKNRKSVLDKEGRDAALMKILTKHQAESRDEIGWAKLFAELAKPEHFHFWRTPDDETRKAWRDKDWSLDFLQDYVTYSELSDEAMRLREPIRFTPADEGASRRLFMFSDTCKLTPRGEYRHLPEALAVVVPLAKKNDSGRWEKARVRLDYSAPRLLRDHLRGGENLSAAPWNQPMMEALGISLDESAQDITDAAVALMPDTGRDGRKRFLLNFPLSLEEAPIKAKVAGLRGQPPVDWQKNCVSFGKGATQQLFYLRAEGFDKAVTEPSASWWKNRREFRLLAVDLGVRFAGAAAVLRARQGRPSPERDRLIGVFDGQPWHAHVEHCTTLRLPGEDQRDHSGKNAEERAGEAGRPANAEEFLAAKQFVLDLDQSPDAFGLAERDSWKVGELAAKMVVALRRALAHQRQLLRWAFRLKDGKADAVREEIGEHREREQKRQEKEAAESKASIRAPWSQLLDRISASSDQSALVKEAADRLNHNLTAAVNRLANFLLPLRHDSWQWNKLGKYWRLERMPAAKGTPAQKVRHLGGLSMMRLEALTDFRRLLQSFNRLCGHPPGDKLPSGKQLRGQPVPDPCPLLGEKLDAMKEQRINQTAHFILAEALGLELVAHTKSPTERQRRDIHGEYRRKRPPVDFIVIEDLSRYRTTQGRTRQENTRLMQWCHRQVSAKLKMLCEPYDIAVLETPAAYSSRFCSLTGQPGFRGQEITAKEFASDGYWKDQLKRTEKTLTKHDADDALARLNARCLLKFREILDILPAHACLFAPRPGGQMFLASGSGPLRNADLNAAINLGFRAIAAPDQFHIHSRIRSEWKKDRFQTRETRNRFGSKPVEIQLEQIAASGTSGPPEGLKYSPNFFHLVGPLRASFGKAKLATTQGAELTLVTGQALWRTVNETAWKRAWELNMQRIAKPRPGKPSWLHAAQLKSLQEWFADTFDEIL